MCGGRFIKLASVTFGKSRYYYAGGLGNHHPRRLELGFLLLQRKLEEAQL